MNKLYKWLLGASASKILIWSIILQGIPVLLWFWAIGTYFNQKGKLRMLSFIMSLLIILQLVYYSILFGAIFTGEIWKIAFTYNKFAGLAFLPIMPIAAFSLYNYEKKTGKKSNSILEYLFCMIIFIAGIFVLQPKLNSYYHEIEAMKSTK